MSTTSELRNFDLNWTFDAASSLPAVDCSPLDWPLDLDDLDIMRFDMPSLENSAGHLSCTSQGSPLQYPTNATSRPKHFLHNTNSLNQYHETHSIAPHRPKQQCVPWDLTRSSLAIPTNAHMNPKHGHHQLGRNIIDHSANRTESRPKHSSAAFVDGVGEMKKIPTKSESSQAKVFKCRWEGCRERRNHFRREVELMRHIKTIHVSPQAYQCNECNMFFNRRDNLEAHARRVHHDCERSG